MLTRLRFCLWTEDLGTVEKRLHMIVMSTYKVVHAIKQGMLNVVPLWCSFSGFISSPLSKSQRF